MPQELLDILVARAREPECDYWYHRFFAALGTWWSDGDWRRAVDVADRAVAKQ